MSLFEPAAGKPQRRLVPVRAGSDVDNATRNRRALKRMSQLELQTGRSPEWWSAWHAENRARVLKRYGIAA